MTLMDRRAGLRMAVGGALAAMLPGGRAAAQTPAAGQTLALVEKGAGRVGFYALPGGRAIGAVVLGRQPHEIAGDAAGRFAYVGHYGVESWKAPGAGGSAIWVIDLHRRALARTIDLAPFGRLHAVRLDDRGRLYVLSEQESVLARFDDPATDTAPSRLVPVGGVRSHYLVIRRDGARAYVADTLSGAVIMVDPENVDVAPVRKRIGTAPEGLALSPDERTLYVVDRPNGTIHALDAATLAERAQRRMRGEAVRVVTQRDGGVIVSNFADKSLSRLDPVTLAEQARLPLAAGAAGLTLAGDTLHAALEDDRLATIDLRQWRVTGMFATAKAPDAAVVF